MCKNKDLNIDILIEYCKSHTNITNVIGVENISVVGNDIIYFKLKLDNNYLTPLNSIKFSKYKLFERDFKLKNLDK
jgi:hypothetical protein